jgi:hypothetical protein
MIALHFGEKELGNISSFECSQAMSVCPSLPKYKGKELRSGPCYRSRLCCSMNGILTTALGGLRYSENVDVTVWRAASQACTAT